MTFFAQEKNNEEFNSLIEANRARALWSLPRHYFPSNRDGAKRILERIAARGDRASFVRARRLLIELR